MGEGPKSDRELFNAALEISDALERTAFLDRECRSDGELRRRINSLLAAFEQADEFLEPTGADARAELRRKWTSTQVVTRPREGPGAVIGNFKLLQEIGEGGFGVVYMAEQLRPIRRKVALKIIKPGMDTRQVVARFEAERQALALMSHPHIAQVFDGGTTDSGLPYFVLELVRGIPITEFCDKSRLSTDRRLKLFLDVCGAIQHAHQKGVIHRDIKPSNILITLHDGQPVAKVIDFGIAKALNQELTEKTLFTAYGQMIGTPQYTSPEQAEMSGLDIDTRSDIYSLGVLLYELLTGQPPISMKELTSAALNEIHRLILDKEPTRPSLLVSQICRESTTLAESHRVEPTVLIGQIKGDLDWIVMKALEKDRARRYETVNGFAMDIRRHLENEPVLASPPTFAYLVGKFARRNKKLITAVSAVFGALLIGAMGMTFLYLQASADRSDAVEARRIAEQKSAAAERAQMAQAQARQEAQGHADRIRQTLARADLVTGIDLLEEGEDSRALAHLARSLRTDMKFLPAAQAMVSALRDRHHHLEPKTVLRHEKPISDFILNEQGNFLLSHATDGSVRLWDTSAGALHHDFQTGGPFRSASFTDNGTHVITLGSNGVARVRHARSKESPGHPIEPEGGAVRIQSATTRDGHLILATRSGTGHLQVWDGLSGLAITNPLHVDEDIGASQFELSEDGTRLLGRFGKRWLAFWDTRSGLPTGKPINITNHKYWFASTTQRIAGLVDGSGQRLRIHNLETGEEIGRLAFDDRMVAPPLLDAEGLRLIGHFRPSGKKGRRPLARPEMTTRVIDLRTARVTVEFSERESDPARLPFLHAASGNSLLRLNDFTLRVRSLKTGRRLYDLALGSRLSADRDHKVLHFSPSGDRFLVALDDHHFEIYRTTDGKRLAASERQPVRFGNFTFSPDGQRVASKNGEGRVQVWDVATGEPLSSPFHQIMFVGKILFSPDGTQIINSDYSMTSGNQLTHGILRVWNIEEGRAIYQPVRMPRLARHALLLSNESLVATATRSGDIVMLDIQSGMPLSTHSVPGTSFSGARISPLDDKLVGIADGSALVWNLKSNGPPIRLPSTNRIFSARFSKDGSRLMTAAREATVRVWDANTGKPLTPPLETGKNVVSFDLNPDATRLVAATDESAFTWNLTSANPALSRMLISPKGRQYSRASFSPDEQFITTVCKDRIVRVWHVATGQLVFRTPQHPAPVSVALVSRDNRRLATFSDGRVWLYPMPINDPEIPAWLPELAEAVAGFRLDAQGNLEGIPSSKLLHLRDELSRLEGEDDYSRFARWFSAHRSARALAPGSDLNRKEWVQQLFAENTNKSLRHALKIDPANPLAYARLANFVADESGAQPEAWQSFAEWYSLEAIRLAPRSADVWAVHADILWRSNKPAASAEAVARASSLAPGNPNALYMKAAGLARNGKGEEAYLQFRFPLQQMLVDPQAFNVLIGSLRKFRDDLSGMKESTPRQWMELALSLSGKQTGQQMRVYHYDWLSRLAVESAPDDPAIALGRQKILRIMGALPEGESAPNE